VPRQRVSENQIEITLIGHATFLIQVDGLNLITDPVYSERASPFHFAGPKRVNPPGVKFDDLPAIDVVLLTHNHYDHLDLKTLSDLVTRDNPTIVSPLGNDTIINGGVSNANIRSGDWHDELSISANVKIHFEPCHHWSARSTRDRRMALWSAFVIETPAGRIYHIGDTGFHSGINYRNAAEKHSDFELAIIPIGAYEPRWFMKGQHQNPFEAVEGFKLCNTRKAIGHHWGTFQLTNESIEEPKELLAKALSESGLTNDLFIAMVPGQVWKNQAN
ncbi:MAG: MBL fold metallo-hydrolase, partial [Desulfobulbia bacterium]